MWAAVSSAATRTVLLDHHVRCRGASISSCSSHQSGGAGGLSEFWGRSSGNGLPRWTKRCRKMKRELQNLRPSGVHADAALGLLSSSEHLQQMIAQSGRTQAGCQRRRVINVRKQQSSKQRGELPAPGKGALGGRGEGAVRLCVFVESSPARNSANGPAGSSPSGPPLVLYLQLCMGPGRQKVGCAFATPAHDPASSPTRRATTRQWSCGVVDNHHHNSAPPILSLASPIRCALGRIVARTKNASSTATQICL